MTKGFLSKEQLLAHLVLGDIPVEKREIARARLGEGAAYSLIGDIYYNRRNYHKAASWHKLGADARMYNSYNKMGVMYHNGFGVTANYKLAMEYYMKAQAGGNLLATNSIGLMYEKGQGVIRNYQTALKWYLQAGNKGSSRAQCNVGRFYEYGFGVQVDKKCALKWYQKSADQGLADAQVNVQRLRRNGIFVNNKEKHRHFVNEKERQEALVISLRKQKVSVKKAIVAAEIAIKNAKKEIRSSKFKSIFSFGL